MTRSEMTAAFLATLDELATHPTFSGGTPGRPQLDCDTVMSILLEQVDAWHRVPYQAIRAMFATLLEDVPIGDVERIYAAAADQLETAESAMAERDADLKAQREAETAKMLENLETLRTESPEKYQQAMGLLAKALAKVQVVA
jgi:hypothetical protein